MNSCCSVPRPIEATTNSPRTLICSAVASTGKLTVWSATQVPHYLHRELARVLDLDVARVRVVQPTVGGAFGGKSEPFDLEFCVAKLSSSNSGFNRSNAVAASA